MKFFIPMAENPEKAEGVYEGIKKFAQENMGWPITNRRIRSISFEHEGKKYVATVGEPAPRIG